MWLESVLVPEDPKILWIVVIGAFASIFTAFGIGSNDVANAFGTSVGSRSLTLKQVVLIASVCEFAGAVLMGGHVTSTVRKSITDVELFEDRPDILALGMLCALVGAGTWLLIASRLGMPVSTTHSIIGAIIGFAVAAKGVDAVHWTDVGYVVLSWVTSPVLSGLFAMLFFMLLRAVVFRSANAVERGHRLFPFLVAFTLLINTFFILYKGGKGIKLDKTPFWVAAVAAVCVALVAGLVAQFFGVPYIRRRTERRLQEAHPPGSKVPVRPSFDASTENVLKAQAEAKEIVRSFDAAAKMGSRHTAKRAAEAVENGQGNGRSHSSRRHHRSPSRNGRGGRRSDAPAAVAAAVPEAPMAGVAGDEDEVDELADADIPPSIMKTLSKRLTVRMLSERTSVAQEVVESKRLTSMHSKAEKFEPRTEALFSSIQVITAIFNSFSHGANDVANSIAPFAAIYAVYTSGEASQKSATPWWIMAMGGFGIVLGLTLYGYRVIAAMGVKVTAITPSRGFVVELSAALIVLIASRIGMPVSTTHAAVGAAIGVGLAEGRRDSLNWRLLSSVFLAWIITLIFASLSTAALFSFAAYSPSM